MAVFYDSKGIVDDYDEGIVVYNEGEETIGIWSDPAGEFINYTFSDCKTIIDLCYNGIIEPGEYLWTVNKALIKLFSEVIM